MTTYSEKLKDPRWQKMRLKVLKRDNWACMACFGTDATLHVHHTYYESGRDPWEYDTMTLFTVCEECHKDQDKLRIELQKVAGYLRPEQRYGLKQILEVLCKMSYGGQCVLLDELFDIVSEREKEEAIPGYKPRLAIMGVREQTEGVSG